MQKSLLVETSLQAWPFRCHPVWVTGYVGSCVVIVISPKLVTEHLGLKEFLDNAKYGDLKGSSAFFLKKGCSIYCPVGSWPCVLGVPDGINELFAPPKNKRKKITTGANIGVGITPAYAANFLQHAPRKSLLHTASLWLQASPFLPASFTKSLEIDEWKEALQIVGGTAKGVSDVADKDDA